MKIFPTVQYVKNRMNEKSTWGSIGVAVVGANALAPPWSYLFILIGVIGTLVPTSDGDHHDR